MDIIWEFTKIAKGEFSLLGIVDEIEEDGSVKELRIREVHLPKQDNSQAATDIDDDSLHELLHELIQRNNGDSNRLRCWIHSHGDMGCFWSGTDTDTIKKWAPTQVEYPTYVISLVVNKKKEYKMRLDIFIPDTKYGKGKTETFDNLKLAEVEEVDEELFAAYYNEYLENTENVETEPLFNDKQDKIMRKATDLCLKRAREELERIALIVLADNKMSQTKIRELITKDKVKNTFSRCLSTYPDVRRKIRAYEFDPTDFIIDYLNSEVEEEEANA